MTNTISILCGTEYVKNQLINYKQSNAKDTPLNILSIISKKPNGFKFYNTDGISISFVKDLNFIPEYAILEDRLYVMENRPFIFKKLIVRIWIYSDRVNGAFREPPYLSHIYTNIGSKHPNTRGRQICITHKRDIMDKFSNLFSNNKVEDAFIYKEDQIRNSLGVVNIDSILNIRKFYLGSNIHNKYGLKLAEIQPTNICANNNPPPPSIRRV